jgi:hypothetical protein
MQHYLKRELSDIYLVYGQTNCNARTVQQLYRERLPQRDVPDHRVFSNVHHTYCDYGSLRDSKKTAGRPRVTGMPSMEQNMLDAVEKNPSTSVRAIVAAVRESRNNEHRVVQDESLCPYDLQRV